MAKGMVRIEADRCKGCGLCVDACPKGVLQMATDVFNKKGYRPVRAKSMEHCTGCAVCAIACPDVVFTVFREKKTKKSRKAA